VRFKPLSLNGSAAYDDKHNRHDGPNGPIGHNDQNASSGAQFDFQYIMMIEMSITIAKIH
jgi:hypothetical protein